MIIYLASYPRSGNSWLQNIFRHYFAISHSNYYMQEGDITNLSFIDDVVVGDPFIIINGPQSGDRNSKKLAHNCGLILTPEFRKKIANDKTIYLIKTHELPYEEYFENEFVIYIIRHPGAVVWSYLNFKKDFGSDSQLSLEELILGDSFVSTWDSHVNHWTTFGETNPSKYLLIKYEDIGENISVLVSTLERICQLPILNRGKPFPGFDFLHNRSAKMYRKGQKNDWINHLSIDQVMLLWLVNKNSMMRNSYDLTLYDQDLKQDKLEIMFGTNPFYIFSLLLSILSEKENLISSLTKKLSEKDKESEFQKEHMVNKDNGIIYLKNQIFEQDNAIKYLNDQINKKDKAIENLNSQLNINNSHSK